MGSMSEMSSKYWLDHIAEQAMAAHPEGEIVVESGHAPSGYYHIGTLREILTASAIAWRINQAGRQARHIDFVDDLDALRKIPAGVPEEWRKYIGQPLYLVPDPTGKHASWAEWLLSDLYDSLRQLGLEPEVRYAHIEYPTGAFTPYIESALDKLKQGRVIITELSKRELPEDWSPVQILSESNSLREWNFTGWDKKRQVVYWCDSQGDTGELDYTTGRVKLDWRFDWPARWALLGVNVEPFGRDHASRGGSYDTGAQIIRDIFGAEPPMPVPYDFINRAGDTKKMSKSAGDVVTVKRALEIMPPEIVRFFILKSLPSRQLFFDQGVGLYNLIDEYAVLQSEVHNGEHPEFEQAYRVASATTKEQTISAVPFGHLVQCYQAAERDDGRTLELLERSGHSETVARERDVILRELRFVNNWLDSYAPENVRFSVQKTLPKVQLSDEQKLFLTKLAKTIEEEQDLNGQGMHDAIYAAATATDLKPGQAFVALYRVILGQDSGPKAGWFLASLNRDWLTARLRDGSNGSSPVGVL
jgi:lysyl-tRNA synthetase class 1